MDVLGNETLDIVTVIQKSQRSPVLVLLLIFTSIASDPKTVKNKNAGGVVKKIQIDGKRLKPPGRIYLGCPCPPVPIL
jgi:hypothetical protein